MKAIWNNKIIAESDDIVTIEGNSYFPVDSADPDILKISDTHTVCHWKGTASYYNIDVDGKTNKDAAWYYPDPKEQAKGIKGRVAFWKGVKITD
ncbi:DUF427 domain-containing protein [Saccharicrinis sp. FJH2]|uniref:DUF427 domain-containing protein n=1 Tax=Saccharicrinis sp. FJH65 TaxID=3344659 RepID=UPI0035F224ED